MKTEEENRRVRERDVVVVPAYQKIMDILNNYNWKLVE